MAEITVSIGGREFVAKAIPWGQLRRLLVTINRIAAAIATGYFDEGVLDDMTSVLSIGYCLDKTELDALPTSLGEIQAAFEALVKVSGLEAAMEKALGEARRAGLMGLPATPASTPGTPSTPT